MMDNIKVVARETVTIIPEYSFHELNTKPVLTMAANGNITFNIEGEEYLRITETGFFVRGEQVAPNSKEAEQVYNAFKQWLVWAHLVQQS